MSALATTPQFRWSVLPPVPLMGVGTGLVESVEHYVMRLAWIAGTSAQQIVSLETREDRSKRRSLRVSQYCGPGIVYKHRIERLQALTGIETIRCGSFLVLDHILSAQPLGRDSAHRRWCPTCYRDWDHEQSCEPLYWLIEIAVRCPIHACDLETRCQACASKQWASTPYELRRRCQHCKASLGGVGRITDYPAYYDWAEGQLLELIQLCATPDQAPIAYSSYQSFVRGLHENVRAAGQIPNVVKGAVARLQSGRAQGKVSLRKLINLCALQGIRVSDLLLAPIPASSKPLLALWRGFRALDYAAGPHREKALVYERCLTRLMKRCRRTYLPPMGFILQALRMNRALARELAPEIYEDYEAVQSGQGQWNRKIELERVFHAAAAYYKDELFDPYDGRNFYVANLRHAAKRIAIAGNTSVELAEQMSRSVLWTYQALEDAKFSLGGQIPTAFVEPKWASRVHTAPHK